MVKIGLGAHFRQRRRQGVAGLHIFGQPFQTAKRRVAFVHVPHRRIVAQRPQRAHAADAQNDLLLQAAFQIAVIQAGGEFAIGGRIAFHIGIDQEQRHAPHLNVPQAGVHHPIGHFHRHEDGLLVFIQHRQNGRLSQIEVFVDGFLPAVFGDALAEIALPVEKAHGHERQAQIAGLFQVIAAENAQTAGIHGQRFVQAEFGGKIRNRVAVKLRESGA